MMSDDIYGGTYRMCEDVFSAAGCEFTYLDMADMDQVEAALRPNTKMLYIETPTDDESGRYRPSCTVCKKTRTAFCGG